MASRKTTESKCRSLKPIPGKKQTDLGVDQPKGLILRCSKNGVKSWVYRFTAPPSASDRGKRKEMKFASYGTGQHQTGLVDARLAAAEFAGLVRNDVDPRLHITTTEGVSVQSRSGRGPRLTDINNIWIQHGQSKLALNTKRAELFKWKLLPDWIKNSHIDSIKRKEILKLITELEVEGRSKITIRTYLQYCGKVIGFAQQRGEDISNPFTRYAMKTPKPKRARVLTNNELRQLWDLDFGQSNLNILVRFILLTGSRRTETMLARWNDIDIERREWTLPAYNVKTKQAHTIPFDSWLQELLVEHRETYSDGWRTSHKGQRFEFATMPNTGKLKGTRVSEYVFPEFAELFYKAKAAGKVYNGPSTMFRYYLNHKLGLTGGKTGTGFTLHDLRRTVATRLKRTRFDGVRLHPDTVRATLNHREAHGITEGVYATFDPADVWPEHKQGLELWSSELRSIVAPGPTGGKQHKPLRLVG